MGMAHAHGMGMGHAHGMGHAMAMPWAWFMDDGHGMAMVHG